MKRKFKKIFLSLACSLICTSVIGLSAVNISPELTITTDKDEYSADEEIIVDVSLKNGTDNDIKDISINSKIPDGLNLSEGNSDYSAEIIANGDSISYNYTLISNADLDVPESDDENSDDNTGIEDDKSETTPDIEDESEENNTNQGENGNNDTDVSNQDSNKKENVLKSTTDDDKESNANVATGDDSYNGIIIIFIGSFIIILGLSNRKIRKKFFILILIGGLVSSGFVHISALEETTNNISGSKTIKVNNVEYVIDIICRYSIKELEDFIPSTDAEYYYDDNMYGDSGNSENISYNNDTLELYYNNEIIVSLKDELSSEQESKLLSYIGDAIIVGKNVYTKTYQIRFNEEKTFEELDQIKDILISSGYENVHLNHVVNYEKNEYYPNDELWNDNWSDVPGGINWNMEAINAPYIWNYKDNMADVKIGVFDEGFTENHEDLNNIFTLVSPNADSKSRNHGTHVSGIMGAQFDNEIGICGVCPTAKMIGTTTANNRTEFVYTLNLTRLITEGCKVINMSMAEYADYIYAASQSTDIDARDKIQKYLTNQADTLTYYLKALLNENFDFVIATCAGNQQYIEIV